MTLVTLVTASGEQHGLINRVANSVKDEDFKHMTPETKAKAQKQRKEDSRKVKARYENTRGESERLTKPYCRWAGDPIETWHFIPGEIYDVPMGLVNEVNEKFIPERADKIRKDGTEVKKDGKGEQIHRFVPIAF